MLKAARAAEIGGSAAAADGRSPAHEPGELPVWRSPDDEGRHALSMRRLASYAAATEEEGAGAAPAEAPPERMTADAYLDAAPPVTPRAKGAAAPAAAEPVPLA